MSSTSTYKKVRPAQRLNRSLPNFVCKNHLCGCSKNPCWASPSACVAKNHATTNNCLATTKIVSMTHPWSGFTTFLLCISGWGMSTFIMGFVGKGINFETGLFWQLVGSVQLSYNFLAILNGICFTVADLAYFKLSNSGMDVSTLGPLTALYVIVPITLGVVVLREPLTPKKLFGLVLAVAAIYILSSAEHETQHISHPASLSRSLTKVGESDGIANSSDEEAQIHK